MSNQKSTLEILFSYFSYIILFIGSAFVSGSIVHSGNPSELAKYAVIGIVGVSLFIGGQFIQEFIINKDNLKEEGIFKFFFYSLLLSVGIGMISGGTQHYSDFPSYSSYLIPIGFTLSLIAYLLKNNYSITKKLWTSIIAMAVLVSIPLFIGLSTLANNLNAQKAKDQAELCAKTSFNPFVVTVQASVEDHGAANCPTASVPKSPTTSMMSCPAGQSDKAMPGMCMADIDFISKVKDNKSFIEYVIPHHQDAVDSSKQLLTTTQDPELKTFLQNVIKTQSSEITMLKGYYKTWFGNEYKENGNYQAMMKISSTGLAADKEYVSGMLGHHSGIIDVAKAVLADKQTVYKPEILELSKQIIKDQEADNVVLTKWLKEKYNSVPSSPKMDVDGHMGH